MADEAVLRTSLAIRKGNVDYSSKPAGFSADVTGEKGPTPGAVAVTTYGTDISLSQLTTPGFVRLMNLDATNYVEYGIYYTAGNKFLPLGEIGPGESYVLKFSRNLFEDYAGTGTGTSADVNTFRIKANTASCNVLVEAFEA